MTNPELQALIEKLEGVTDGKHSLSRKQNNDLLDAFCRINPPAIPEAERHMELIIVSSGGRRGGVSIKPGNIILNWSNLLSAIPSIALTSVGTWSNPYLFFLGALVIWKDFYAASKVEIDKIHAIAIVTMWKNCDGNRFISEKTAKELTNKALKESDMNQLSDFSFARVVDDLSNIGCIQILDGKIWLREWIRRNWA